AYEGDKVILKDAQGKTLTGWQKIGGTWFYADANGVMQTGWVKTGGKWYWLASSGAMATNTWVDGGKYYVGSDGTWVQVNIIKDFRSQFSHGTKTAKYQKYIVIHDTEGGGTPQNVIAGWASNGRRVAAHFVIGKDGTIVQCVPLDQIAHHAGYGNKGHNAKFGVPEDGRDDMKGATPIGSYCPDYGMNSYSIGIELIHQGSSGEAYPKAQLEALNKLIAHIDSYYGFESTIIDHKTWRIGNSDTSKEFAKYLANYRDHRTYN
ncbi:MAG: N-acetylmuramoyl-L-alanine amidase, partial [Eggerthellaceae bacterium]